MTNHLFQSLLSSLDVKDHWLGDPTPCTYPKEVDKYFPEAAITAAQLEIKSWPVYTPTALRQLPTIAEHAGVSTVWYKDESTRFDLGSFKALGGAYAVLKYLASQVGGQLGRDVTLESIRSGKYEARVGSMTVATATDGNHGRSVAWGAKLAGCQCRIYIHKDVSAGREAAMAELGADVIRINGNYDQSVKLCAEEAEKNGWQMISDTSYEGYTAIPTDIMAGYTVMVDEILTQSDSTPTHVFIQAGVGGLAAAVSASLWSRLGPACPKIITVESEHSDCILRSLKAGKPTPINVETETIMAGLSCGEVSLIAWEVLRNRVNAAIGISDAAVPAAMRYMASGDASNGDKIEAGECAVPGIIALLACAQAPELKTALDLNQESVVLVFGCEGATDPALYNSILAGKL